MGSRGAFLESGGFRPPYGWHAVGVIQGIKILERNNPKLNVKMPDFSNTPGTSYIMLYKYGRNAEKFKALRVYNNDRSPSFDIDYHMVDGKMSLHKHLFANGARQKAHLPLTTSERQKYETILREILS